MSGMNYQDKKAIIVQNVGKYYRIGAKEQSSDNLLMAAINFMKSPLKNFRTYRSLYKFDDIKNDTNLESHNVIAALRDVSFEVAEGEAVGVIGHNGAGKSTLLKILSRITTPTFGRAVIRGRISSLLEVGTGFHPELTGRENVYLNGTILGMRKSEIDQKYDDIVEFSGIKKFINTPVKRYSSGMRVRLAFSVAAHLEPEILIVDEVLAVGDAEFQKKCINKMQEVEKQGRTVIFVSHNMQAITRLCKRAVLIENGVVIEDGPADKVIGKYLTSGMGSMASKVWSTSESAPGSNIARLISVKVKDKNGQVSEAHDIRNLITIEMEYIVLKSGYRLMPNFHFFYELGVEVFTSLDIDPEWRKKPRPAGRYTNTVEIPGNLLAEGLYSIRAVLVATDPFVRICSIPNAVAFTVVDSLDGNSARGDYGGPMSGVIRPKLNWRTQYQDSVEWPTVQTDTNAA